MASGKTWLWILVGGFAAVVIGLIALAGAGVYFVTQHVHTEAASGSDATRAFDAVLAGFDGARPLYELDAGKQPRTTRPLAELPTASRPPANLWILAWDPEDERLVRLSLPFWMLRLGRQRMNLSEGPGWEIERLDLDIPELERIEPALVFDYRDEHGVRVLLWTE